MFEKRFRTLVAKFLLCFILDFSTRLKQGSSSHYGGSAPPRSYAFAELISVSLLHLTRGLRNSHPLTYQQLGKNVMTLTVRAAPHPNLDLPLRNRHSR